MDIQYVSGSNATKIVNKFKNNLNIHEKLWTESWSKEKFRIVACLNDRKSFCILHKMDFDPASKHSNPWILDMIYTPSEYRRRGFATKILQSIRTRYDITAFCSNESSENLFKKNNYVYFGEHNHCSMYRST
jgi:hypothetical protein